MRNLKAGIRILAIAESFNPTDEQKSILAGLIMRKDFIIDGLTLAQITKGGDDATNIIINIYKNMKRNDINLILLNGCILSLFNIVDLYELYSAVQIPAICLNFKEGHDLEGSIKFRFKNNYISKVEAYRKLGVSFPLLLETNKYVYLRLVGIEIAEAALILNDITLQGNIPEPIRVARLISNRILNFLTMEKAA